jgi:hypothetical protein
MDSDGFVTLACYIIMGIGAALGAGIAMSYAYPLLPSLLCTWPFKRSDTYSIYRWAHGICSDGNEERDIITGGMNQMAYVFQT